MQSAFPAYWIHHDEQGRWGWKFAALEGEFTAQSVTKYSSQQECLQAIRTMMITKNLALFSTIDEMGDEVNVATSSAPQPGDSSEPLILASSQIASEPLDDYGDRGSEAVKSRLRAFGPGPSGGTASLQATLRNVKAAAAAVAEE